MKALVAQSYPTLCNPTDTGVGCQSLVVVVVVEWVVNLLDPGMEPGSPALQADSFTA